VWWRNQPLSLLTLTDYTKSKLQTISAAAPAMLSREKIFYARFWTLRRCCIHVLYAITCIPTWSWTPDQHNQAAMWCQARSVFVDLYYNDSPQDKVDEIGDWRCVMVSAWYLFTHGFTVTIWSGQRAIIVFKNINTLLLLVWMISSFPHEYYLLRIEIIRYEGSIG